ncbi:MAG: hypothetical protein H0T62_05185 [Parachlamydiaceae bacterium]|nr:hypothetical protein [Parachlamydiaceae bacterium]
MNTNSITHFINDNYTIVYRGEEVDESDLSTANEFLIADNHGSSGHNALNSLFINTFAEEGDVAMIEAIASMEEVQAGDALQSVWLNTKATVVGWDIGKVGEVARSSLFQESGDIEIRNQILLRQFLDQEFKGNKEEIFKELVETISKSIEVYRKIKETGALKDMEIFLKFWPDRIKSMKSSMDKGKDVYKRTFLIAGQYHLKNNMEDQRFSLEEFYDFLKGRKVVILFPKNQTVKEMGKEVEKIVMGIQFKILFGGR